MSSRLVALVTACALSAACSSGESSSPASSDTTSGSASGTTASPTSAGSAPASATSPPTSPSGSTGTTAPAAPTTAPPAPASTSPTSTTAATSPGGTTSSTARPAPEPEPDLTADQAADKAAARTALITLDDFPDGWVEDPEEVEEDDPVSDAFEAEFDECLGRNDDDRVGDELEDLKVATGDFHPIDDNATSVSHEVVLAPDEATAISAMTEVVIDGAEACLADVIERFYVTSFADDPDLAGITVDDVVVTRTERDHPADLTVGVLLEVPLTLDGQQLSQFLEVLYQRQGRALSELSFSSFGQMFSRDGYDVLSDDVLVALAAIG